MPGPIVELSVMPLMYLPLAAEGLARTTLVDHRLRVLDQLLSGVNESLPTGTCTSAVLSVRNSTLPALISRTAAATSFVTVPVFGLGIRPRGTEHLAQASDRLHHVRSRDQGVKVRPAFLLNLLDQVLAADKLGTGCLGFPQAIAGG